MKVTFKSEWTGGVFWQGNRVHIPNTGERVYLKHGKKRRKFHVGVRVLQLSPGPKRETFPPITLEEWIIYLT